MEIEVTKINKVDIAEIHSDNIFIKNAQEALDLFANCMYQGANRVIVHEKNIIPDLFDLKTGIAGEVFQKCSNYRVWLAIVGDFTKYSSKSLRDFIFESNKGRQVNFVESVEIAKQILSKN